MEKGYRSPNRIQKQHFGRGGERGDGRDGAGSSLPHHGGGNIVDVLASRAIKCPRIGGLPKSTRSAGGASVSTEVYEDKETLEETRRGKMLVKAF